MKINLEQISEATFVIRAKVELTDNDDIHTAFAQDVALFKNCNPKIQVQNIDIDCKKNEVVIKFISSTIELSEIKSLLDNIFVKHGFGVE